MLPFQAPRVTPLASCASVGEPGTILGAPPCIYGFFMYLAIATTATFALIRQARRVS